MLSVSFERFTWTDPAGRQWHVKKFGALRLGPRHANAAHAAIRAFVFARDGFACLHCGVGVPTPTQYDGRAGFWFWSNGLLRYLTIDHIVPRSRRGTNHPDNLQTLCDSCNARKGAS